MSGTTAYRGRSAVWAISANGGSTFVVIGGVRATNLTVNNSPVDITNVSSNGFREMLADGGTQSVDVTIEGVVVNDATFETFLSQAHDRTLVYHRFSFADAGAITSRFVVSSHQYGAPHDGAQTFNASLSSSGTVTFVEPT